MKIEIKYKDVKNLDQKRISSLINYIINSLTLKLTEKKINDSEVSILVTNNFHIKQLNLKYKNLNKETNVLSFPQDSFLKILDNQEKINLMGDIVLSIEKIEEEAKKYSKRFEERLAHMIIHGLLHLLGYNHQKAGARKKMEKIEREMMSNLYMSDPYCY